MQTHVYQRFDLQEELDNPRKLEWLDFDGATVKRNIIVFVFTRSSEQLN